MARIIPSPQRRSPGPMLDRSAPKDMSARSTMDASAVFSFGDSLIIKIRIANDNTRREPRTLAFLATKKEDLSFDTPTILFYTQDAGKTYLIGLYITGRRLNEAWWDMPEEQKEL
ncbi:hypothetical protein C8A01DRAFT_36519 [Parachaetomium inaequale]|uniref:Uncharacterized protein n=1 Tax=Parachaetomium inaequale TaxID=2588326 RepID=A0AAN6PHW4_9PEZI|nr:hypothetical protein C8A01DRAFT_36519 [Parachaetomium inaequale]